MQKGQPMHGMAWFITTHSEESGIILQHQRPSLLERVSQKLSIWMKVCFSDVLQPSHTETKFLVYGSLRDKLQLIQEHRGRRRGKEHQWHSTLREPWRVCLCKTRNGCQALGKAWKEAPRILSPVNTSHIKTIATHFFFSFLFLFTLWQVGESVFRNDCFHFYPKQH